MTGQAPLIDHSSTDFRYILKLFFELIDSIRYVTNYFEEGYEHLQISLKLKTTKDIDRIAHEAADYFFSELKKNPSLYLNDPQKMNNLKFEAIDRII